MSFDPFGSMQAMMGQFQQFFGNPAQFLMQRRLNLPQGLAGDPAAANQYLLNNGMMSQEQYNNLRQLAGQIQNNPQFRQFIAAFGGSR